MHVTSNGQRAGKRARLLKLKIKILTIRKQFLDPVLEINVQYLNIISQYYLYKKGGIEALLFR